MHTNFDFLKKNKEFSSFSEQAAEAERSLSISPSTAAILSRRALELAVRWVFVNDDELRLPYRDNLSSLVHEETFRSIIEPGLFPMLKFIIKLGNAAVHTNQKIRREDAVLCLRNLFENVGGTVEIKTTREDFQAAQGEQFLMENFDGSLPRFITAFYRRKKLSSREVAELRRLIEAYEEDTEGGNP